MAVGVSSAEESAPSLPGLLYEDECTTVVRDGHVAILSMRRRSPRRDAWKVFAFLGSATFSIVHGAHALVGALPGVWGAALSTLAGLMVLFFLSIVAAVFLPRHVAFDFRDDEIRYRDWFFRRRRVSMPDVEAVEMLICPEIAWLTLKSHDARVWVAHTQSEGDHTPTVGALQQLGSLAGLVGRFVARPVHKQEFPSAITLGRIDRAHRRADPGTGRDAQRET